MGETSPCTLDGGLGWVRVCLFGILGIFFACRMHCCLLTNGVLEDKWSNISGVVYGLVRVSVFCCVPSSTILVRVAGISSHTSPAPFQVSIQANLHRCMWTSVSQVPSLLLGKLLDLLWVTKSYVYVQFFTSPPTSDAHSQPQGLMVWFWYQLIPSMPIHPSEVNNWGFGSLFWCFWTSSPRAGRSFVSP